MAKEKKKKKKWGVPVFLVILVLLFIVIYAYPDVTGALKKTVILEYRDMRVSNDVTCYFVREESVYLANQPGKIGYYVTEGEPIRKGVRILGLTAGGSGEEQQTEGLSDIMERVQTFNAGDSLFSSDLKKIEAEITLLQADFDEAQKNGKNKEAEKLQGEIGKLKKKRDYISAADDAAKEEVTNVQAGIGGYGITPSDYVSPASGVVSFFIDGYEGEFTPESMTLLTKKKVEGLKYEVHNVVREQTAAQEPLYKIVNNKKWYAVFWVKPGEIAKYEVDSDAQLSLPLGQVQGTIDQLIDDNGEWMVIMSFNRYYKEFAQIREAKAQVITSDYKGLVVPNESITTEKKQTGVYVKDVNGEFVFRPVEIITSDGENSIVKEYMEINGKPIGTVKVYDEILKKPN